MVDLDRLAAQEYTPEVIVSISESFFRQQENSPVMPLTMQEAGDIVQKARTASVGIPQLIQNAMKEVD